MTVIHDTPAPIAHPGALSALCDQGERDRVSHEPPHAVAVAWGHEHLRRAVASRAESRCRNGCPARSVTDHETRGRSPRCHTGGAAVLDGEITNQLCCHGDLGDQPA